MFLTYFLIGAGLGLFATALVVTVYELTTDIIRQRVKTEIPEAEYVKIQKIYENKGITTLPTYRAKAYNRNNQELRDIEFNYTKSEYFYDGEKILI